ncbi:MAG: lysophospholipid acyltransferase family protein [Deltaproteobacteria bacterium]|nr:lysophospholipid acyltransferase family protein [Deltaproteobacteria bacterium]
MRLFAKVVYAALRLASLFVCALPESWVAGLAALVSRLLFGLIGYRRRVIRENLKTAFPELDRVARRVVARDFGRHITLSLFEVFRAPRYAATPLDQLFEVTGLEHYEAAARNGRGVLALSGHLGNWELVATGIARALPNTVLNVVVKSFPPGIQEFIAELRTLGRVMVIPAKDGLPQIIQALSRNEIVVIVLDQNATRGLGVFVPFFGRPACTMSALASIAMWTGASVLPCAGYRGADGRHHLEVFAPLSTAREGSRKETILSITRRATEFIERRIRAHPEQWLWTHRRWRTQPHPESGEPETKS